MLTSDGWCRLSILRCTTCPLYRLCLMCFTICFMLHASALRMVLVGLVIFIVFEGLLDDIVIILGAETGNRSLI